MSWEHDYSEADLDEYHRSPEPNLGSPEWRLQQAHEHISDDDETGQHRKRHNLTVARVDRLLAEAHRLVELGHEDLQRLLEGDLALDDEHYNWIPPAFADLEGERAGADDPETYASQLAARYAVPLVTISSSILAWYARLIFLRQNPKRRGKKNPAYAKFNYRQIEWWRQVLEGDDGELISECDLHFLAVRCMEEGEELTSAKIVDQLDRLGNPPESWNKKYPRREWTWGEAAEFMASEVKKRDMGDEPAVGFEFFLGDQGGMKISQIRTPAKRGEWLNRPVRNPERFSSDPPG